jgi:peptidoglycan-associated lipoprotein
MKKLIIIFLVFFVIGCSSGRKYNQYDSYDSADEYAEAEKLDEGKGISSDQEYGSEGDTYGRDDEGTVKDSELESEDIEDGSFDTAYSDYDDTGSYTGAGGVSPFKSIYFNFDSYEIHSDSVPVLESVASWMRKNRNNKIIIEGHCDERGTNEYNLALGDKRASAVKDYLVISGITSNRITTVSYGEERPTCQVKDETCYQKNRRADVVLSK